MKKFTKKDLINKLGMSEEKAKLIMKAQNEFPELLCEDNKSTINSARDLYLKLGMDKSHWSRWIKRNIKENNFFEENKDWWGFAFMANGNKVEDFKVTVEFAKHLCMQVKDEIKGHEIRSYFIYLEEAIKDMDNWIIIREPEKQGHKEMCEIIDKQYQKTHEGEKPNFYIYTNNSDMLNLCLFGYKSKQMKSILDVEYNEPLRDNLTSEANKCLYELQQLNSNLLLSNLDFKTRKLIIENTCKERYMDIRVKIISEFNEEIKNFKNN